MKSPPTLLIAIAVAIVSALLGIWAAQSMLPKTSQAPELDVSALVLKDPRPLSELALTTHHDAPFGRGDLLRKWTFLFFGYSNCPDVCPTTLATMNEVYQILKREGDLANSQFIFVSVDPERDTVEQLAGYIPFFNPDFIGLTGEEAMIKAMTYQLGAIYYLPQTDQREGNYPVDHSASILLIDPQARMRASFPTPHEPQAISTDFRKIRARYAEACCELPEKSSKPSWVIVGE